VWTCQKKLKNKNKNFPSKSVFFTFEDMLIF
jgi:hypothetical protein